MPTFCLDKPRGKYSRVIFLIDFYTVGRWSRPLLAVGKNAGLRHFYSFSFFTPGSTLHYTVYDANVSF